MALKDFDDANPRTRDKNWKEGISVADLPRTDEWYPFRIVGGIFSYAQHWIEFVNKEKEKKRYPVDCANWDSEKESATKKGGCPACEAGLQSSARYMMNVIDRTAQSRGDADPLRALDIPPTVMRQLIDLKKLNVIKGEARSIAHPKVGCDIHLQKQRSKKRGGIEWQIQKGDRSPLTEEEMSLEFIKFDEHYMEPDVHKIREDLKRHGYFETDSSADENDYVPSKGSKKTAKSDDDDDFEAPARSSGKPLAKKRPPVDDDDDDDDDEEDDVPPPKRKAAPVDDDEDDDDDVPPKRKAAPVDDDEDDAPPVRTKKKPVEEISTPAKTKKKKPPVEDDDDDFDTDFDT